ncbi:MAG: YcaO-like family protein [Beijerinckiaceae bacterium]
MSIIEIAPLEPGEISLLLESAGAEASSFTSVLMRLSRLFRISGPDMPGLVCIGAVIALDETQARAHGGPSISATGTGVDDGAALVGCLAEAAELLSQFEEPGDVLNSAPDDPRLAGGWLDASASSASGPIDLVRVHDLVSGEAALAAADLCLRRHPVSRKIAPVGALSAGCAAGRTTDEAATRAVLELIERDAAALWWKGGRPAGGVDAAHPCAAFAAERLAQLRRGIATRTTMLLDLTNDFGVPVIAAASYDVSGRNFACGLAARLEVNDAADAALREMGQMELAAGVASIKLAEAGEAALGPVDRHNLARAAFDARECELLHACARAPDAPAMAQWNCAALARHLADRRIATYRFDLTRPTIGVPVVRAIAPALQPYSDAILTPRLAAAMSLHGGGASLTRGMPLY